MCASMSVLVCERGAIYWHCNAMLATGQHEREQLTKSQIETLPSEEERGETGWERDTDSDRERESEEKEKER